MLTVALQDLRSCFGFGVAGNFAGHLEQAGEAADFAGVSSKSTAPKGIFPYYAPGFNGALGRFPLSHDRIAIPVATDRPKLQLEPEVGLLGRVNYRDDGSVEDLLPIALGAFNDCSIRRPDAKKISEKKNWGHDSKGVARSFFTVSDLSPDGPTRTFRLASFLYRGDRLHAYGIDCPLPGYSYYGQQLLDWIVDRLNFQTGSADSPLESVGEYLRKADCPTTVLIGIGATRYTSFGEHNFLNAGDETTVVVYDNERWSTDDVRTAVGEHREDQLGASVLRQVVYKADV